jgi:hypothetical protein
MSMLPTRQKGFDTYLMHTIAAFAVYPSAERPGGIHQESLSGGEGTPGEEQFLHNPQFLVARVRLQSTKCSSKQPVALSDMKTPF